MSETQNPQPFIRPCDPIKDLDAVHHICQATLPPALQSEPAHSISPYIWARPYLHLHPQHCHILDNGHGLAVGYIVGTPSTIEYITRFRAEYIPALNPTLLPPPDPNDGGGPPDWEKDLPRGMLMHLYHPEDLLREDFPEMVKEYPAHLHVDLLPEFQRRGWGRRLMERFLEGLKREGVKGVHLVMASENKDGEHFYEKMKFERYPVVLDGGVSGELGRHPGGIWLVKRLA